MNQKTTLPKSSEVAVKKRLILAPQSAGRIGKSTAAEAILSWMEFADLDCALFDLDQEHLTISQRYPDLATVFPEAVKNDDGWSQFMTAVIEVAVPTILSDLPAQSTGFLLRQLIERDGLRLWDAAGVRLTLLIFPAKDAAARESAVECVKVLGDRVDWLVIRQPGPKPLVEIEEWASSKLGARLKELGAMEMDLPRITTSALEAIEKSAKAAGRWLSISEAIGRVGMVAEYELEFWRNRALVGCEDAAKVLIPDLGMIQKKTIRLKAPAIYRKSEGPIFDLMNVTDSERTRQLLLEGRSPEVQLKLAAAWEKFAEGDPESSPVTFAMAQLHLMDVHSSMMDREAELLVEFREVCQEQRLLFQSAVSQESKAILNGFEKRLAIFEQKQQLASESPSSEETPKKTGGLLPMALAAVIGMIGGGYAMNQHNEKQFQAEKVTAPSPSGKRSYER